MADLLECLIQIKALGETLGRITRLAGGAEGSAWWEPLAEAERRYAKALGTEAGMRPESTAAGGGTAALREAFIARRHANLAALNRCTAAQLAGRIDWPGRRATTVADLVAIMLASDTELLGAWRQSSSGR
jgi:hypothetical protein